MKKKFYLLFLITTIADVAFSDDLNTDNLKPDYFVRQYITDFNDQKNINRFFHFPVVWLVDNNSTPKIESDASKELINYENLKKTGWVKSVINDLKVIHQSENRAFVLLDFSRLDSNDNQILRSEVMYTMTKQESNWGIKIVASASPFIR